MWKSVSQNLSWDCFHVLQLGRSDFRRSPAFFSCPRNRGWCHFLPLSHSCPKNQLGWTQASLSAIIQNERRLLKAQIMSFCQVPGQDVSVFYRTFHELAGMAYTDTALCNEFIRTTFIGGLAHSVVRWEVQKSKPTVIEDAVSLALEMQSSLKLHWQQPDTSAAFVNSLIGLLPSGSELFSSLNFTIKEEVKRVVKERRGPRNRAEVVNVLRPTSSRPQQSESNSHACPSRRRNWNHAQRNPTNRHGNSPNRSQSLDSKNGVSVNNSGTNSAKESQRYHRNNLDTKKCKTFFRCGGVGQSVPAFKLKQLPLAPGGCEVEPNRFSDKPAIPISVLRFMCT